MISVGHKYYNQISMACSNFVNIFVEDNIEERKKKKEKDKTWDGFKAEYDFPPSI